MQAKSTVGPALLGYNLFTHIRIFNKHLPFHTKIIIMNINILIMSAVKLGMLPLTLFLQLGLE